ncbi:hypothetical protein K1719_020944 [Acacia pycnantha]|nr:hypothetical protein K1719_020944 [Acacia pycnantha]
MKETKKCRVDNTIISDYVKLENLPKHLIHDIMHLLPYKDAAKFSVLSKSLNPYWLSFPTLNFNYNYDNLPKDVSYDTFFNFVQKTLQLRGPYIKGCLQNLTISYNSMGSNPHHYPKVFDVLLNFAVQNNVEEINFDIKDKIIANVTYDLLRPLFSSQFLTVLKLAGVKILSPDNVFITCPKLTELQFQNCHDFETIHVSSSSLKQVEVIQCFSMRAFHILEGNSLHSFKLEGFRINYPDRFSPFDIRLPTSDFLIHDLHLTSVELSENIYDMVVARVELLFIDTCGMPKNMRLHSPHIKVLEMTGNYKLQNLVLTTPNLERFISEGQLHRKLDISDCVALITVLKLDGTMSITSEWLKRTIGRLRSLKELVIRNCSTLERVEFESDSLEKFSLYGCFHLLEVDVNVSNLLEFYYSGGLQVCPIIISSFKCNGNIILPYGRSNLDLMKQFLSFFDHFKDLTLSCSKAEDMIIPRQLNDKISPLYDLRHVKLQVTERFLPNGPILTQLLESLLWFVPRPHTITLSSNMTRSTRSTLKFKYGNIVESNDVGECCLKTDSIKCWRHYEVKIEFEGFDESVREYLEEFFATSHRYYGIYRHG